MLIVQPIPTWAKQQTATFAMGCFWCAEQALDKVPGVLKTTSGYSGGHVNNPSYKDVSSGTTGHIEAVQVIYEDTVVSFDKLLHAFWTNVDPLTRNRQFCDRGYQYSAAIFAHNPEQAQIAKSQHQQVRDILGANEVLLLDFKNFYPAESYHQDYYLKNPVRYNYYKYRCGRESRLEQIWSEEKTQSLYHHP